MNAFDLREPVSAWTHGVGLLLAIPGALLLWRRAVGEPAKQLSLVIYGVSLFFCYAASTLFHAVQGPADERAVFARWDSIGIFALIAGTYTPLAWNLMKGQWRACTLAAVWGTALTAIVLIASGRHFSSAFGTRVYLVMGWGGVICYARIARVVSQRALMPLVLGGVFYSVGAVLNRLDWPNLWPNVFGAHELFHLFVMAGSFAHYWFILMVVVPFGREDRESRTSRCRSQ